MKRRKALILTASLMGATIIGSEMFLTGCSNKDKFTGKFTENDIKLLDEVGEVILPNTELSPGAKNTQIGLFMEAIVSDCYDTEEQIVFMNGIKELNKISKQNHSLNFLELNGNQKFNIIKDLDNAAREKQDKPIHFFSMIKQLTIWGYFSSEPGMTKALRYNPIPGKFTGCVPYKKGEKAWV